MSRMIIVASGKGGTGKTTFTSQIGTMLAQQGFLTVLVDADAGFRNLDIALGLESSVVYDYSDYINGDKSIDDVLVKSSSAADLYFVAAPQSAATSEFDKDKTKLFWDTLKARFDFVIADAPAGMGDGFMFAAGYADEAIIVSFAESAALRDADRVIEELENTGISDIRLVLNRIKPELIEQKIHMNVDDCIDVLSIPILGIIPDDVEVAKSVVGGEVISETTNAGQALLNITKRILGADVLIMEFKKERKGLWTRLFKAVSR